MKNLLEAINRGILRGLYENNIELLADLDGENLNQLDSIQTKSINNKIDGYIQSIKRQLTRAIQTGKPHDRLKQIINDPKNFNKFKWLIKANDKNHLKELIQIGQNLFGNDGNFNWIDTSSITGMSGLFFRNYTFNGHIELWDVSNVTNMHRMFDGAYKFNQPIGDWNVSNVTDMCNMFKEAEAFNQTIDNWDVSNVTDMAMMFCHATKFNQPIGDWDVSSVIDMQYMFYDAESFNQPIGDWDVSNVTNMEGMFIHASNFKQSIDKWDINSIAIDTASTMFGFG